MKTFKEILMEGTKNILNKLKKAEHSGSKKTKTDIWYDANLSLKNEKKLLMRMILSVPGDYKLHSREYGNNLIDKIYDLYGRIPSLLINEELLLGMAQIYPQRVFVSFTHDMDKITIKK